MYKKTFVHDSLNFRKCDQYVVVVKVLIKFHGRKLQIIIEIYFENRHTWCVSGVRVKHAPRVSWPALVRANEWTACVKMSPVLRWTVLVLVICVLFLTILAADSKQKPKKKKDIRDYNDADMARLLEQWEVRYSGAFLWKLPRMSAANHSSTKHFMLWIYRNLYWHRTYPESWHYVMSLVILYLNAKSHSGGVRNPDYGWLLIAGNW